MWQKAVCIKENPDGRGLPHGFQLWVDGEHIRTAGGMYDRIKGYISKRTYRVIRANILSREGKYLYYRLDSLELLPEMSPTPDCYHEEDLVKYWRADIRKYRRRMGLARILH